ncbi:C40 family peptidase [Modestobacter altitudinis]|uniref:C40 family peptidase n=1 Tax=Modestobacter altitudinis TaxID=2213158 RepID=UPI001FE3CD91|nr:C40 family peptidase [Modestobacter altitudinis]
MATTDNAMPRPPLSRLRVRRLPRTLTGCALAGALFLALAPGSATAAPPDATSGQEAAALATERGHDLEVLTEDYNEARETLSSQQTAVATADAQVAQAEARAAELQDELSSVAQAAFTGDGLGSLQAFMTSSSAEEFLDRVALLNSIADHHNDVLARVAEARSAAEQARAAAESAALDAQQQVRRVASQQEELQGEIADYQAQYALLTAEEQTRADVAHGGQTLAPPSVGTVEADSATVQAVLDTALAQVGDPYVWAAAGPDAFDCSGLTQYAFAAAGVALPHSSAMQATMGQPVSRADIRPGDLVYFYSPVSHIGIYIGGGRMVHASTFGDPVKVSSVDMAGYAGARRVLP